MQAELDALRLLLAKEHSFSPDRRYLTVGHDQMIPLLIIFNEYFMLYTSHRSVESKRLARLLIASYICEANFRTFYEMTVWQISTITNFLTTLNEEESGKAYEFLKYVENEAQVSGVQQTKITLQQ